MPLIEVYFRDGCPFCDRAFELFDSKKVSVKKIDIGAYPEKREEMLVRTAGRTSVPEIFIDGKLIGGCDDLFALEEKKALDPLL